MAYEKLNLADGDVLKAEHLAHMEDELAREKSYEELSDKPFGEVSTLFYEGENLTPDVEGNLYVIYEDVDFKFSEGGQYTVILDGTEYTADATKVSGDIWVGNPSMADDGYEDNGLPFAALAMDEELQFWCSNTFSAVSISCEVSKMIDDKYIPVVATKLYHDSDMYLYPTSDTSDTSNRLTRTQLYEIVESGKPLYVVFNSASFSAAVFVHTNIEGSNFYGIVKAVYWNEDMGTDEYKILTLYTAEYSE